MSYSLKANEGGFIEGFQVRGRHGEGEVVSHLLFVDDTVIFCDNRREDLKYLSCILMWFEALSRVKINLEKRELIPIGEVLNVEDLMGSLGCKVGALPTTYLGLPLGGPFKASKM